MKIYNSLTNTKEEFITIEKSKIKMYICGQTVYDFCHLGHARKAIAFDMIRRWFLVSNYEVTFIENITDIDDKIINKAKENNEQISSLTTKFIDYMHEDFKKLNIIPPSFEPLATNYIPQMINIIENLLNKGYAYKANNGDIYFSVKKFPQYGKLSGRTLNNLRAGERVTIDKYKLDPLDFVLWKKAKENEPYWQASFGIGRPGWHIECSAMAEALLGKTFDIHGGGLDLQFPHHENEIAQSEAHNDCILAKYWLHNGFLTVNDEKMSKSLNNSLMLRELFKNYNPEVLRLFILKTHYRKPLNFTLTNLEDAENTLIKMYQPFRGNTINSNYEIDWQNEYALRFKEAMDDDFNTPLAISILFELLNLINTKHENKLKVLFIALAKALGLLFQEPENLFKSTNNINISNIEMLIIKRNKARHEKNYIQADEIREELLNMGIILEDGANGTTWRTI